MLKFDKTKGVWRCTDCNEEFWFKIDLINHFILKHTKNQKGNKEE